MEKPFVPVRALLSAALKSRVAFDAIQSSEVLADLNDTPGDLWREIQAYYEKAGPEAKATHTEIIQAALERRYTNPKHRNRSREFLSGIVAEDITPESVSEYLRKYRMDRAGEALAAGLLARRGDPGELLQAYLDACNPVETKPTDEVSYLDAIRARVPKEGRIRLRLKSLNERFRGGVLPGHSIIIAGRPNAGKSALAISLACGLARDGRKGCYIGNEDPIEDLMVRAVSNVTGLTADEIEKDPEAAAKQAEELGLNNLKFIQLAPGTMGELERVVREEEPEFLVVDQLRNISSKSENFTQRLDETGRGVRNLGLKYKCVTISVTQLGDSAEGKPSPDMGDLDNSKTGLPGACDVLLLMGTTEALRSAGLRRLNLPKNKVGAVEDAFDVRIDTLRSKVTSIP